MSLAAGSAGGLDELWGRLSRLVASLGGLLSAAADDDLFGSFIEGGPLKRPKLSDDRELRSLDESAQLTVEEIVVIHCEGAKQRAPCISGLIGHI